ncbi:MAG TPA: squalene/phytoene synthase family protein [Gemmatimonadaceae bacterium]|nr:squalene/phytoene synthase family protein [Gemmatimonadaceae bacterium]
MPPRAYLIARNLLTSRERPDLERMAAIQDPEQFVWSILPHAARTFSACIAILPRRLALPAAVGYLYCRMLDTYEDLVPEHDERDASLRAFAARLGAAGSTLPPAPPIEVATDSDDRDRSHLLLVRKSGLVDQLFLSFPEPTRVVVRDLVNDMAEGMRWSSATFEADGGVLDGEAHVAQYCRNVLGNPVVFSVRLMRLAAGRNPELAPAEREDAMLVGEMVQLANVTRDVEKDLARGIAYDAALRNDLGRDPRRPPDANDAALLQRCRDVRARFLRLALSRATAYRRMMEAMPLRPFSGARASALLMLLFTERYFRSCARRIGAPGWQGPDHTLALLQRAFVAAFSRRRTERELSRIEREFLSAAATL